MYFCVLSIVNSIISSFIPPIKFCKFSIVVFGFISFFFFGFIFVFLNFDFNSFILLLLLFLSFSMISSSFSSFSSFPFFILELSFISFLFSSIKMSISLCKRFISLLKKVSSSSILFFCKYISSGLLLLIIYISFTVEYNIGIFLLFLFI